MKLVLRGVHYTLNDRIKDLVEKELHAPLDALLPEPACEMDVQLKDVNGPKGGLDKEVAVTVHIPTFPQIFVVETSEDMFKSVHLVADRLDRVVRKHLERRREHGTNEPLPTL